MPAWQRPTPSSTPAVGRGRGRGRGPARGAAVARTPTDAGGAIVRCRICGSAVSYTHLTLPTICSV
eukprot:7033634-Alexandrium_andersonii.AAC.1